MEEAKVKKTEEKESSRKQEEMWRERSDSYLRTVFSYAPWIKDKYRKLLNDIPTDEEKKPDVEILNELYLCACDGVPIGDIQKVLHKESVSATDIIGLRHAHVCSVTESVADRKIRELWREVLDLMEAAKQNKILLKMFLEKESVPDELFAPEEDVSISNKKQGASVPPQSERKKNSSHVKRKPPIRNSDGDKKRSGENEKEAEKTPNEGVVTDGEAVQSPLERGDNEEQRKKSRFWARFSAKGNNTKSREEDLMDKLLEANFALEQRQYILSLLGQGIDFKDIKSLANPKFPVDVMKGLREIQERREKDVR